MKSFFILMGVFCLGVATAYISTNRKTPAPPAPIDETTAQPHVASTTAPVSQTSPIHMSDPTRTTPHFLAAATQYSDSNPTPDPAIRALKEAVDQIVTPNVPFKNKQEIWNKLIADGRLDETIEALKQGATNNPDSADYQAALGEANLKKAGIVSKNGGTMNELAILGMTADQSFDNALKIDPANWEAQFFKAVSMSYWPVELNKGTEVIQRLTDLIARQDQQTTRPEFALPYIALGQQYQKIGQADNAMQTWQAGAARFPGDTTLQQKLAAAQPRQ